MRKIWHVVIPVLAAVLFAVLPLARPVHGQAPATDAATPATEDAAEFGEAAGPIEFLKSHKDKTLVFVFDVSGSMDDGGNLHRARAAAIKILRQGVTPGDHVVMLTFGAGYKKVFDTTVATRADVSSLVDQVPAHTEQGAGTNIRKPHHEALKIVDADLPHTGVIVLLTDSFNDEPKPTDATYPEYLDYYTPGGQLTKYPKTPENRDYERLLRKLKKSGKLTEFGIGIKIADDDRPIERLPQAAPPPVETPDDTTNNAAEPAVAPAAKTSPIPIIVGIVVLIALGGGTLAAMPLLRASALRITGGPAGSKDFQIKNGQSIRLGGDGANVAFDAYAVPGAREPIALIAGRRGQLFLNVAPATSNQSEAPRVYHNGLLLEREEPLSYGDELRISVQEPSGAFKEYRLKFDDPRKGY